MVILLQGSSCRHYQIGKYSRDEGDCRFRGLQNELGFCYTVQFLNRIPAILLTLLSSFQSPSLLSGASLIPPSRYQVEEVATLQGLVFTSDQIEPGRLPLVWDEQ